MEKPNVRFHDGQILSEEPLNKAMEAVDYAVEEANKVPDAVNAASSAAESASATAAYAAAIDASLEEIKGSGDIPAATIAQVAENTADISKLALNQYNADSNEYTEVVIDADGKILESRDRKGDKNIHTNLFVGGELEGKTIQKVFEDIDGKEDREIIDSNIYISITLDTEGRIISAVDKQGCTHIFGDIVSPTIAKMQADIKKGAAEDKDSILYHNNKSYISNLFQQAARVASVGTDYYQKQLVLVHCSDIHGYGSNLKRLTDFCNIYDSYIDDILHTGDTLFNTWGSDSTFWSGNSDAARILNCIGNHDVSEVGGGGAISDNITSAMAYDRFFAPYIDGWNVSSAGIGKCYYYKDYETENIRLIVLDSCKWTNEEGVWLTNTLNDARSKNIHVICASHFPCGVMNAVEGCTFDTLAQKLNIGGLNNYAMNAVDEFINGGGTFVCWLVGHSHLDYFGTLTDHPKQLVIAVANAGLNDIWNDTPRIEGTKTQDCFNILSFDTHDCIIRGFRIGADYDRWMRHKGVFCYDYDKMKLIYNN